MTKGMELDIALELACSIEIDNMLLDVISYDLVEEAVYCIDRDSDKEYGFTLKELEASKSLRVFSMEELKIK